VVVRITDRRDVGVLTGARRLGIPRLHTFLTNREMRPDSKARFVGVAARAHRISIERLSHDPTVMRNRKPALSVQNLRGVRIVSARPRDGVGLILGARRDTILSSLRANHLLNLVGAGSRSWRHKLLVFWTLFASNPIN
jgi:hypothetical protein